jgi:hypothetical protein
MRRLVAFPLAVLLILSGLAAVSAAPATAATVWTSVASGTTETITAMDVNGPTLVYATDNGKIFQGPLDGPYAQTLSVPLTSFTDVAISPGGTSMLATTSDGRLYVWNGSAWAAKSLSAATWDFNGAGDAGLGGCNISDTDPVVAAAPGRLFAVAYVSETLAVAVGGNGVVLAGAPAGAFSE